MDDLLAQPPRTVYDHIRTRAVVVHNGAMLLLPPAEGVGAWLPPGGGLEVGEDLTEATVREVYEETGVRVRVVGLAFLQEWVSLPNRESGHDYDLHVFVYAEPIGDPAPKAERADLPPPQWVPLRRVSDLPLYPAELKYVADLLSAGRTPPAPAFVRARLEPPTGRPRAF